MENSYDKLSFAIITTCNMLDKLAENLAIEDNNWAMLLMSLH